VARAATRNGAPTVTRATSLTGSIVGGCGTLRVEAAIGPTPHPSLPVGADGLRIAAPRHQSKTGRWRSCAGLGLDGWVDGLVAVVGDSEGDIGVALVGPVDGGSAHVMGCIGEEGGMDEWRGKEEE
jgi:hypothetical protein